MTGYFRRYSVSEIVGVLCFRDFKISLFLPPDIIVGNFNEEIKEILIIFILYKFDSFIL